MNNSTMNAIRNVLGGLLYGYGFVSFLCFIVLEQIWISRAPSCPDSALGLIYRHNEHGSYTYFSKFEATASWLMFSTSIPMCFTGALIAPRKNLVGKVRRYGAGFKWDRDDPSALMKQAALVGAAVTPLLIYFVGPHVIRGLNAAGFVMNLG